MCIRDRLKDVGHIVEVKVALSAGGIVPGHGEMCIRDRGCAPAHNLFELVHVQRKDTGDPAPARSYQDYTVAVDEESLPTGVTCTRMG